MRSATGRADFIGMALMALTAVKHNGFPRIFLRTDCAVFDDGWSVWRVPARLNAPAALISAA